MKKDFNIYEKQGGSFTVDLEWLEGVENIEDAAWFEYWYDKLRVVYKDGDELWYQNCHGTWGFPTRFA